MANRRRLWIASLGLAGALAIPAAAQYQYPQNPQAEPSHHDQDDQNRDRNRSNDQYNTGDYNRNNQFYNTKAYQQGLKDGRHDRSKNKGERADKKHFKNDQDRQAYESGYYDGYRGNGNNHRGHDQDDQRHDH